MDSTYSLHPGQCKNSMATPNALKIHRVRARLLTTKMTSLIPVCLWIWGPHSRAPEKNTTITSHGNEVLPQDTKHLIQRPCYQWESPSQDPAGNQTTQRLDHRKEVQTAVVRTCLLFIRFGQNHLARHSKRGKKTRQTEEEVGRHHLGMDRPGVR